MSMLNAFICPSQLCNFQLGDEPSQGKKTLFALVSRQLALLKFIINQLQPRITHEELFFCYPYCALIVITSTL